MKDGVTEGGQAEGQQEKDERGGGEASRLQVDHGERKHGEINDDLPAVREKAAGLRATALPRLPIETCSEAYASCQSALPAALWVH